MLVGWVVFEFALLVFAIGLVFPRLAIRLRKRRYTPPPPSRRGRWIKASAGLLLIGFIISDWSGLRIAWQGRDVAKRTSGILPAKRVKQIDDVVVPAIRSGEQIGLIVGVVDHGRTWTRGYGRANMTSNKTPDGDSVFEIGSITKTFTCTALAAMCVSGDTRLQDPVRRYLPDGVRVPTYAGRQIRLVDLATQTSGLPRLPGNFGLLQEISSDPYAKYTRDDSFSFLNGCKLPRAPGATYEYSNFGMGLLGLALARKADSSYEQMITRLVCKPLDMSDTSVSLSPSQRARLVQGYAIQNKVGRLLFGVPIEVWTMQDSFAGAGALRSTANDMLKYVQANIEPGSTSLGPALAMTHAVRHKIDDSMDIGLAWHTLRVPGVQEPIVWHNGGTGGYRSFIGFLPKKKLGVVVLGNTAQDVDALALVILVKLAKPT